MIATVKLTPEEVNAAVHEYVARHGWRVHRVRLHHVPATSDRYPRDDEPL